MEMVVLLLVVRGEEGEMITIPIPVETEIEGAMMHLLNQMMKGRRVSHPTVPSLLDRQAVMGQEMKAMEEMVTILRRLVLRQDLHQGLHLKKESPNHRSFPRS